MRQPPKPDWLDNSSRKREPFFGYNAIPFAIQFVAGILLFAFFKWIGVGELGGAAVKFLIDSLS